MRISDWSSDVCSSDLPQPVIGVDAKDTADLIGAVDRGRGRHIARGRYADVQLRSDDIVKLGAPTRALDILVNADVGLGPDVRQARRSGQRRPDRKSVV